MVEIKTTFLNRSVFDLLQIVSFLIATFWLFHLPVPGFAVTLMAFVTALMSLQPNLIGWRKFTWMALIALLTSTELRAIHVDRQENQLQVLQESRSEAEKFKNILDSENTNFRTTESGISSVLQKNDDNFRVAMAKDSALLTRSGQALQLNETTLMNITGSGFAYLITYQSGTGEIIHPEPVYLRSVRMRIVDENSEFVKSLQSQDLVTSIAASRAMQNQVINLGDLGPTSGAQTAFPIATAPDGSVAFNLFFSAISGEWFEQYRSRVVNGQQCVAIRVRGQVDSRRRHSKKLTTLFELVSPSFPRDHNGRVEWESGDDN